MARNPKRWWWKARTQWGGNIDGQRHLLGPDKEDAQSRFHELMSDPNRRVPSNTVASITGLFSGVDAEKQG